VLYKYILISVFSEHLTLLERAIVVIILSVCLSVYGMDCDKMKESCSVHIFIPHERAFTLVLSQEEWLVKL